MQASDSRVTAGGPAAGRADERGTALILSLLFTIIAMGIVASGSLILRANQQRTDTSFRLNAQAMQFARSGITDGLSWFRRQTSQPVLAFEPVLDPSTIPPTLDTDDPDIGIVREFKIGESIWGRYEVWKEWDGDPDPDRLQRRQQMELIDVSSQRGQQSAGTSWRIRSYGAIYRRLDPALPLGEGRNVRLAQQALETEIKRLRLAPPGQSAVSVADGNSAHINTNGRIRGGADGSGIYYPQGTGSPTVGPAGANRVSGTPSLSPTTEYDDSIEAVFGLTLAELISVADDVVTNVGDFPNPIPTNSILIATPTSTLTFDSSNPLRGTALVYIQGNVTISPGSNSVFNGLLYVDGNLTVRAPSEINGAVVCTGNLTVQGSSDFATINFDEGVLNALRLAIGNYRLSGAIRPMFSTLENR